MFKEIRTENVYMHVVRQIRDLISKGILKPGDRLPAERQLAHELGVSRPSVREGIVALEIMGLVESRAGRGSIILDGLTSSKVDAQMQHLREEESPFELLEARKTVEVQVVAFAAERATPEDISAMRETLDKMKKIVEALSNPGEYEKTVEDQGMELDRQFHTDLARAAHNAVLFRIVSGLLENLKEDLWVRLKEKSWNVPGRPKKYLQEHEEILAAIQNRDKRMARNKILSHLTGIHKDLFGRI
jgi:DNA-binding FadR family transcriptional regulator